MTQIVTTRIENWLNGLSAQAVFVLVAGFFGLAMAVLTPPGQVPDEPHHWYRIYQLTQGKFVSPHYGGDIPASMLTYQSNAPYPMKIFARMPASPTVKSSWPEIRNDLKEPLEPRKTRFVSFSDCAVYSPVPYLPQTLAMLIATKAHWPALWLLYAGRVGTLLGYLLIGYSAIRIAPILKWPACMILTNPMALFLAGSLSEDPVTISMVFLATALALRCILLPGKLSPGVMIALALVMTAVALCKSAYFPVVLLVLAVPGDKWGTGYRRWVFPLGMIALSIGTVLGWSLVIKAGQVSIQGHPAPGAQLSWIRHHPLDYAEVVRLTLVKQAPILFGSAVGLLGWMDTWLAPFVIDFMFIALAWVALAYDEPIHLPLRARVLAGIAAAGSVGAVITACYLYANAEGSLEVVGIQGRYFLPPALMFCMLFRRRGRYTVQPKWMVGLLSTIALYTVWVLIARYYIPAIYL